MNQLRHLRPAASAKGTVRPSLMPITTSLKKSLLFKCSSLCGHDEDVYP